jgi:hypothetical protein
MREGDLKARWQQDSLACFQSPDDQEKPANEDGEKERERTRNMGASVAFSVDN